MGKVIIITVCFLIMVHFNVNSQNVSNLEVAKKTEHQDGKIDKQSKPKSLLVYNSTEEQRFGNDMVEEFMNANLNKLEVLRDSELSKLNTPDKWRAYQQNVRDNLSSIFGEFPEKTPLNPTIIGRIDYPDYYIEKIIYESQPNLFVPANLYVPKNREFPLPGILVTIGHSNSGKHAYRELGVGFAKKGYVVLLSDPIGQGERSEYFDPKTLKPTLRYGVGQHNYLGRPAILADWSLSSLRTWDCIRAVDYLVSRPEVDSSRLGVVGNSGGGQMALIITAVDTRIKVVAAGHPGGSMEATYLNGQGFVNKVLLSLIAPRPCRIIVGDSSGEEGGHRRRLDDMVRFYKGLGESEEKWGLELVDGKHNMRLPKRISAYDWMNKWFDKTGEGNEELALKPESPETFWSTENGIVLESIGGESGRTLSLKRAEQIYKPAKDEKLMKDRILKRIHLTVPTPLPIQVKMQESFIHDDISVEKFAYLSEAGIEIPALLLRPTKQDEQQQLIIHVSEEGKPKDFESPSSLVMNLVKAGYPVLSIDVRGIGETSTLPPVGRLGKYFDWSSSKWRADRLAMQSASFNRTLLGMRALDVIKGVDLITKCADFKDRPVILIGEKSGALYAMLSSIYRPGGIHGVIAINTLPSYKLLLSSQYYDQYGYFWTPGALRDYDIPDLVRLASPKTQLWIDPINAVSERMNSSDISKEMGKVDNLQVSLTRNGLPDEVLKEVLKFIRKQ